MNKQEKPKRAGDARRTFSENTSNLDGSVDLLTVDYPDEQEMRMRISSIVDEALPAPPSFPVYVAGMYRQLGFRHLFRDLTEIAFVLLLGLGILIFMALFAMENTNREGIYAFIFIVSPLLYLAVSVVFFADLQRRDTYQVEMACRYNVYQLASLRMLVFAGVCLILNIAFVCWIAAFYGNIDLLRGLMLSASSLFLFAAAFLYGLLRGRTGFGRYVPIALWPLLHTGLWIAKPGVYLSLLSDMPVLAYGALILLGAAAYFGQVRRLPTFRPKLF
ncbi:hypothetical protein [Saccharibacillus qingshengii]|uniref:hypothetical protein n=1 Tax=Saccharibacillus qingshengii TaxID=1763540 RepID=UPI0015524D99|nr:hypothetical protein [Saccharibacillus qingshengii]